ncbi:MAG: LysM peptidoglycan-binding domain-containing protein [Phycisphaerales bacterium]|nr:LysM peptidoglycan-binding domain-containing protein [Phycisphaerales bacterium]
MTRGAKIVIFSVVGLLAIAAIYYGYLAPTQPTKSLADSAPRVNETATLTQTPSGTSTGALPAWPGLNSTLPGASAGLPETNGPAFAAVPPAPMNSPRTTLGPATLPMPGVVAPAMPVVVAPAAQTAPMIPTTPKAVMVTQSPAPKVKDSSFTSYTVKSGDTLTAIAGEWFHDTNKWTMIADANPGMNPTNLQVGQKINLPARAGVLPARATASDAKPAIATTGAVGALIRQHVVVAGETLGSISGKVYGSRDNWKKIYEANKGVIGNDPSKIAVGLKLTIPSKT